MNLPEKIKCPNCGSMKIAVLDEDERIIKRIVAKKASKLTKEEEEVVNKAIRRAELVEKYGKLAAIALAGRRLRVKDVESILRRINVECDAFYEKIIEAERNALKRSFW